MGENTIPSLITPTPSENQNMYSSITQKGLSKETNSSEFQIMQIIPPFTKSIISNTDSLNNAYLQCAKSILHEFPQEARNQITISKTFAYIRDKRLHSLTVVSPPTVKKQYHSIRSRGLNLLGKTVFPMGKHFLNTEKSFYPRRYNIKFSNLPYVCTDTEALKLIDLPEGIEHSPAIIRMKDNIGGDLIFNGYATLSVTVKNATEEERLKTWSYENRIAEFKEWNSLEIKFHAPSLHNCSYCEESKLQYRGHHKDWCYLWQNQLQRIKNVQNINKETKNNRAEKQKPTNFHKVPETETISDTSSCNLTIDEEEVEETYTEEICSGTTENATVIEQETENANKTSTNIQNAECNDSAYLNTEKFQSLELDNSAVLKQYRPGAKRPLSETQKQQNAQIAKHFLNDQWIKKKNQLEQNKND